MTEEEFLYISSVTPLFNVDLFVPDGRIWLAERPSMTIVESTSGRL